MNEEINEEHACIQGRHLGGGHLPPPLILENSDFLCFCTHNFVFSYFAPP